MDSSRSSSSSSNKIHYHILKSSLLQFGSKGAGMASNPSSITDAVSKSGSSAAVESGKKQFSKVKIEVVSNGNKDWEPEDDGIDTSIGGGVLRSPRRRLPVFDKICREERPVRRY